MKNKPQKQSKQQAAYQKIRTRILDGTYSPGYRIVIDQLAKEFKASAIPIREAIRQLEADGLIQFKPYSGAIVTPINENEYIETLSVLAVLEGYATALASNFMTEKAIDELRTINQNMVRSLESFDFLSFGKLNRDFHATSIQYCDNKFLVENIKQTWNRIDSIRRMGATFVPTRAKQSISEHEEIISMLERKATPFEIEQFVREHKMNTVKSFDDRKG
ncbi:GntR family transcriptional regulator [Lottiidibacillus patelloidae]|uniref:GntR family transcriptional regulator n=1 Tax=Lottiidibacillus patelloidae TaxID=2670334 RepID=A0A263BYN8_9BACI|nr:GntR family transcriptional regulator [Lottiidibacillus patelloidae]OZM58738.1 GntR family transcriptional regulator [Lottiidibacillus patelloidae]